MQREQDFLKEAKKRSYQDSIANKKDYINGFLDGARYADTSQWVECSESMPEDNERIITRDDETMTSPVLCFICYGRNTNALRALRRIKEDGKWRWMCDDLPDEYIKLWLPTPIIPPRFSNL